MSPSDYTEELLVERPAIELFEQLGWATASAKDEAFASAEASAQRASWLGRETRSEVVLIPRVRAVLERLNPALAAEAISPAIEQLSRDRSVMSLAAANREVWELLRDGVKVSVPDRERGGQKIERVRIIERLTLIQTTDMAVVVSPAQNEIEQMKEFGIDVVPHRKRMREQALDEKFKDPEDPFRLVFVCAMWLTGFDAPSCSTIYLDKPMRNHTLMQTIARANRVYPGKQSGVIVDYANVFASLERALAIYGKGRGGETPVRDKNELAEELRAAVADATRFCEQNGVDLGKIEATSIQNFARAGAIDDAADRLMAPEDLRRNFLSKAALVTALYRAVKPDPMAMQFADRCSCLAAIAERIRATVNPPDISHVVQGIEALLDESIAAVPFTIDETRTGYGRFDLSKIDFEALRRKFDKKGPTNTDLERLKAAVKAQLERMVQLNRTRADYLEKFQTLIESYNAGSRNIEEIFRELIALSNILTEEQTRHVREHLSEEELTIFDILTRPGPDLTSEERDEVKKVAHTLLERLKSFWS